MKEFLQKVAEMRELQRLYFRRRDSMSLAAAKRAEKEVDDLINRFYEKPDTQTKIF